MRDRQYAHRLWQRRRALRRLFRRRLRLLRRAEEDVRARRVDLQRSDVRQWLLPERGPAMLERRVESGVRRQRRDVRCLQDRPGLQSGDAQVRNADDHVRRQQLSRLLRRQRHLSCRSRQRRVWRQRTELRSVPVGHDLRSHRTGGRSLRRSAAVRSGYLQWLLHRRPLPKRNAEHSVRCQRRNLQQLQRQRPGLQRRHVQDAASAMQPAELSQRLLQRNELRLRQRQRCLRRRRAGMSELRRTRQDLRGPGMSVALQLVDLQGLLQRQQLRRGHGNLRVRHRRCCLSELRRERRDLPEPGVSGRGVQRDVVPERMLQRQHVRHR